jgi:inositol-phosphate transport system permease protein|tara:strand:+ start:2016 stop:2963 length:948 start_codon:yes stop_codon:yes gene_type:complete
VASSNISGKYTNFTVFFLPAIVLLGGLVVLPIFLDIAVAFTDMAQTLNVSGLTNMQFRKFFKPVEDSMLGFELRRSFLKALTLTATYVVLTLVIFNTTFGLVLALTTTALSERVGSFFRAIWLLPRMSPSVVYALLWSWTIDPTERGLLNQVAINIFGIGPINMKLHHPMMLIVISNGFIGASLGMIILTSAIRSIPKHLFYAAQADGAGPLSITWHIILPALRWPLSYITIFQTLALLVSFEYIFLIMGPARSTMTMAMLAYTKTLAPGVGAGLYAYGAAITMILIVIGIFLALLLWRLSNMQRLITEPRIEVQ